MERIYISYNKWKKFFFINLCVSIFTYFMLISLQLLNQLDGIWHYGYGGAGNWERGLGRWVWPYLDEFRFGLLTEPFCNVLALCIFILGNIILFEIIDFEPNQFRTYVVSCMILITTSVCTWLSFRYMSNTFATAYFMAVLTVYFCRCDLNIGIIEKYSRTKSEFIKDILSVILASLSLMISLGCYQAFFDSTCLILLVSFMLMLYKDEEASTLIKYFIKAIISIFVGAILYFIGMKITFMNHGIEQLSSYNEGGSLGLGNTILKIPETIGKTIYYFNQYFFNTMFRWNRLQEHLAFQLLFFGLIIVALIVAIVRIAKKNVVYAVLFTICALLLPIATNIVLFMATESFLSIQMTNGLAMFVAVAFVLVFEILVERNKDKTETDLLSKDNSLAKEKASLNKKFNIRQIVSVIVVIVSIITIYGNYVSTQIDQEACREGRTGTITIANEILDSLKNLGYADRGGRVCFVGTPCGNERFMYSEIYPMANELMQFGNWGNAASTHGQTWMGIYREYLGYFVEPCTNDEYEAIVARDDVAAMPMYPRAGSITEIDGIIVVKVSNNY